MLNIDEAQEMNAEHKTCAACGGWFSLRVIVIAVGEGVPTAFIHKHCMEAALAGGPSDAVERRFEEILATEKDGVGLLAQLERDQVGAET